MGRRRGVAGLMVLALMLAGAPARMAAADLEEDQKLLREARLPTDAAGLAAYFRTRTPSEARRQELAALVRRLGSDDFGEREQAGQALLAAGRLALPHVRAASRDPDAEVSRRAADCVREIDQQGELSQAAAAARMLARLRPEGAAEALLGYLPTAEDEALEDVLISALESVGVRDGQPAPAVAAALGDREAVRRAAVALVIDRAAPRARKLLAPLLTDADARVRLVAASAVLRSGDRAALPVLLDLLGDGPSALAWQVEDLFFRAAGSRPAPTALGRGDSAARKACRNAWQAWWKSEGAALDLARLEGDEPSLGFTLVCDLNGGAGRGRVWACNREGKTLWQLVDVQGPIDAHWLPGGRLLVAEHHAMRVTERTRGGEVVWEARTRANPVSCQRLANGNTLVATYTEVVEFNREGKVVATLPTSGRAYHALRLRDGHTLYAQSNNMIVELDGSGKQVRTVPCAGMGTWAGVEPLPGGHYLVALYAANRVVEIDPQGREVWEATVPTPTFAQRLRNGNTLVSSPDGHKILELDRMGKEVWSQATEAQGRPFRVRRY